MQFQNCRSIARYYHSIWMNHVIPRVFENQRFSPRVSCLDTRRPLHKQIRTNPSPKYLIRTANGNLLFLYTTLSITDRLCETSQRCLKKFANSRGRCNTVVRYYRLAETSNRWRQKFRNCGRRTNISGRSHTKAESSYRSQINYMKRHSDARRNLQIAKGAVVEPYAHIDMWTHRINAWRYLQIAGSAVEQPCAHIDTSNHRYQVWRNLEIFGDVVVQPCAHNDMSTHRILRYFHWWNPDGPQSTCTRSLRSFCHLNMYYFAYIWCIRCNL